MNVILIMFFTFLKDFKQSLVSINFSYGFFNFCGVLFFRLLNALFFHFRQIIVLSDLKQYFLFFTQELFMLLFFPYILFFYTY